MALETQGSGAGGGHTLGAGLAALGCRGSGCEGYLGRARACCTKAAVLRAVSLINRLLQAAASIPDSRVGQGYASVCCV